MQHGSTAIEATLPVFGCHHYLLVILFFHGKFITFRVISNHWLMKNSRIRLTLKAKIIWAALSPKRVTAQWNAAVSYCICFQNFHSNSLQQLLNFNMSAKMAGNGESSNNQSSLELSSLVHQQFNWSPELKVQSLWLLWDFPLQTTRVRVVVFE